MINAVKWDSSLHSEWQLFKPHPCKRTRHWIEGSILDGYACYHGSSLLFFFIDQWSCVGTKGCPTLELSRWMQNVIGKDDEDSRVSKLFLVFVVSFDNHVKLSSNPSRLVTQPKTRALISIYGHGHGQTRNLAMWFLTSKINFTHTTPMVDPFLHSINWILIGSLFINVIQSQRAEQKREIRVSQVSR